MPGPRIAEALAEVRSHVAETGEDPREAFGPPRAYAGQVAAALGGPEEPVPLWRDAFRASTAAYGLAGAAGAWLLLDGVLAAALGRDAALGLPPLVQLLVGLVVLAGLAVGLTRLARSPDVPVLDPLTGQDLTPPLPRWVLPVVLAVPALTLVIAVLLALSQR